MMWLVGTTLEWREIIDFATARELFNSRVVKDCVSFVGATFQGTVFVGNATASGVPVAAVWRYKKLQ
jgi:hypothetical protein